MGDSFEESKKKRRRTLMLKISIEIHLLISYLSAMSTGISLFLAEWFLYRVMIHGE